MALIRVDKAVSNRVDYGTIPAPDGVEHTITLGYKPVAVLIYTRPWSTSHQGGGVIMYDENIDSTKYSMAYGGSTTASGLQTGGAGGQADLGSALSSYEFDISNTGFTFKADASQAAVGAFKYVAVKP